MEVNILGRLNPRTMGILKRMSMAARKVRTEKEDKVVQQEVTFTPSIGQDKAALGLEVSQRQFHRQYVLKAAGGTVFSFGG